MARQSALPPSLAPRLLSREAAAAYVSISTRKFDELVEDGRMPRPKIIDRRKVWDVRSLDVAVDELPVDGEQHSDSGLEDIDAA